MEQERTIKALQKLIQSSTTTCEQKTALRKAVRAVRKDQKAAPVKILVLTVGETRRIYS